MKGLQDSTLTAKTIAGSSQAKLQPDEDRNA